MAFGNARFHFDPKRDRAPPPSLEDLERWVRSRMHADDDQDLAEAYRAALRNRNVRRGPLQRLVNLLPPVSRRMRGLVEERCVASAMKEMEKLLMAMAEYAVDLTMHPKTGFVETIAAVAVHEGCLEEMRDHFEATMRPDHPRLVELRAHERRQNAKALVESYHEHLLDSLSDEAVYNLLDGMGTCGDARRYHAAMWTARDESRTPRTRDMIDKVLLEIDGDPT